MEVVTDALREFLYFIIWPWTPVLVVSSFVVGGVIGLHERYR